MTSCTESVPCLVKQLCESSLRDPQRAFLSQPTETREQINRTLQRKVYDTIFSYLKSQQRIDDKTKDEKVSILSFVLQLRYKRKFDEANRLETLLDSLLGDEDNTEQDSVRSVLKLLVALADFPSQNDTAVVGYGKSKYPVVRPEQTKSVVLPWGPQLYGDCQVLQPDNKFYMHYPSEIFMTDQVQQPEPFTKEVLDPLMKLSLKLQKPESSLADCYLWVEATIDLLHEYKSRENSILTEMLSSGTYEGIKLKGATPSMAYKEGVIDGFIEALRQRFNMDNTLKELEFFKKVVYKRHGQKLQTLSWAEIYDSDFPALMMVIELLNCVPPTSVTCETTFSHMKLVKTSRRTKLKTSTLNDILLVKLESQNVTNFDPSLAIDKWLLFQVTPGTDLCGNSLFSVKGYLNDHHERNTTGSLFGGLVNGKFTSLEDKLEIPDLPEDDDSGLFDIRIPSVQSIEKMVLDDKASTGIDTMSCSSVSQDSGIDTSIWEVCLSVVLSKHFSWETCKWGPGSSDKRPYITEAGPQALDEWYNMKRREINILCPTVQLPPRRLVTESELCQDIINLMLGIPSLTFQHYKAIDRFDIAEGTHITGITQQSLKHICQDFMDCGTIYNRLNFFSMPQIMDSFYKRGLIFQAFIGAIRKVLQHYRAVILSIGEKVTVLRLKFMCHQLFEQMRFLAKLCKCEEQFDLDTDNQFPTGIELLSYVYQETLESASRDHYTMMLSILQTTCGPYLLCLEDWIFHGRYRDIYGEFMIQVHEDYLQFRDKNYWSHGFTLNTSEVMDSVPLFLREFAKKIFTCGKSINLLKTCCPDHFLCKAEDYEIPKIMMTYSSEEMSATKIQCDAYVSKMRQISRQLTLSREEMKARAEQAKQDLIHKAREVAEEELRVFQERVLQQKIKVDEKKRKQFDFLKDQMKADLRRRASQKEADKEEDKQYIAMVTRQEEALTEKELELERKAREEIVEYYGKLTEEATFREQKALWRVRRAKLDLNRVNFIQQDESYWSSQMVANPEPMKAEDVPDTVVLPAWVDRGLITGRPVVVGDVTMPKWTERPGQDSSSAVQMPEWARKELGDDDQIFESPEKTAGRPSTPRLKTLPSPRIKTGIRLNEAFSATVESEPTDIRRGIQTYQHAHSTKESESQVPDKFSVKRVGDMYSTKETQEEEYKRHLKVNKDMHATKETESHDDVIRPHIRPSATMSATAESTTVQESSFPKLKRNKDMDSQKETEAAVWKIKKPSAFGHPSQLTQFEPLELAVPKLKRSLHFHASLESELRDFGIKPKIRMNKSMFASKESEPSVIKRLRIKKSEKMWATKESEYVDEDLVRIEKFKAMNVYGHSSDSTVQRLLYGDKQKQSQDETDSLKMTVIFTEVQPLEKFSYEDQFDHLEHEPAVDLLSSSISMMYGGLGDYGISVRTDVDAHRYMPLPELLKNSVTLPLLAQVSLVNNSVIDYFMVELHVEEHFQALRRYLFMGDGDFSQILSDLLFEKLSNNPKTKEMLNPVFLNGILTKSLRSSMHADDSYADNLSFAVKYVPDVLQQTAPDTLDCLELRYKVVWPLNIIITDTVNSKYSKVFTFMLQLKRIVWVLKDVWHRLKRGALIHKAGNSVQFRQLQLYRQEMQHFVKVMQGYVANQIIHVSWKEFIESLTTDLKDLDDLHRIHSEYLNKTIFRCLLNKKAAPVMKIIQDIFSIILKFRVQLINAEWYCDKDTGQLTHTNFKNMVSLYKAFREYSVFLFKVVNKLSIRGYQPHLQELLLRLNFNDYYKDR